MNTTNTGPDTTGAEEPAGTLTAPTLRARVLSAPGFLVLLGFGVYVLRHQAAGQWFGQQCNYGIVADFCDPRDPREPLPFWRSFLVNYFMGLGGLIFASAGFFGALHQLTTVRRIRRNAH